MLNLVKFVEIYIKYKYILSNINIPEKAGFSLGLIPSYFRILLPARIAQYPCSKSMINLRSGLGLRL